MLAHLAVFLLLFSHFGSAPGYATAPAMNVVLTRPSAAKPPPSEKATRRRGAALKVAPPPQEIAARPAPLVVAPSALPGRMVGDVQATLRGLIGCTPAAMAAMPREQREACETRLARRQVADLGRQAGRLNLDLSGAFGKDPQAYFERRPHNGCRARAGGDVAPTGEIGVATGIACAKPF